MIGRIFKFAIVLPIALYFWHLQQGATATQDKLSSQPPSADYHPESSGWGEDNTGEE